MEIKKFEREIKNRLESLIRDSGEEDKEKIHKEEIEFCLERIKEQYYKEGYKDGVICYAYWENGEQYVGTTRHKLKDELEEVEDNYNYDVNIVKEREI